MSGRRSDRPDPFVVREHGAGDGALAIAILTGLRASRSGLAEAIRYRPIEVDPRRVAAFEYHVSDAGFGSSLQADGDGPFTGLVLANEVADALPVHRVVQRGAELLEVRVGLDGDRFVDVETAPSTPDLFVRLAAEGITLADGQRGEICLALDAWLAEAVADLERGVALLIDYGYPAAELYDPVRRRDGTLRAYVRHTVHDDPYAHIGRQDLTAHVDVDAVVRAATDVGLAHLGTTTQAEFLVGLGMDEHLQAIQTDPATTMEAYLAVRSSVMRLLDPAATGRFRVMAFGRDWPDAPGRSRRPSAGRLRLPGEVALTDVQGRGSRLGHVPYCGEFDRTGTLRLAATCGPPAGERGVNWHARSARPAPRPSFDTRPTRSIAPARGALHDRPRW